MTLSIEEPRSTRPTFSFPAFGTLLLAMTLSFLAGRATGTFPRTSQAPPTPAVTVQPAEPPPWSEHGFRDGESAQDGCLSDDCNG
jgi:hypothetical protein